MHTKFFRILALVAMLTVSIGPSSAALAADPTVPTSATVSGPVGGGTGTVAPVIECKWELPDMQPGVSLAGSYPDGNIQYVKNPVGGPPIPHDDDVTKGPTLSDGTTTTVPCTLPAGASEPTTLNPGTIAAPGNRHVIQVKPQPHDTPELRRIQLWGAIDPPTDGSDILDINWDVYHSDGSLKTEKHGIRISQIDCNTSLASATLLGKSDTAGSMFNAAFETGQVSAAAIDDASRGLLYHCGQPEKRLYYASFLVSKHQPCGEYKIVLNARAGNGSTSSLANTIDIICFNNIEIDFTKVDFGTITPGSVKYVQGDVVFETPGVAPPVKPTVRNTGNSGISVAVNFSVMTSTTSGVFDTISTFDACFVGSTTNLVAVGASLPGTIVTAKSPVYCVDPIAANTQTSLQDTTTPKTQGNGVLCANRPGKLDLSIHPQSGISAGDYTGTLKVVAVSNAQSKICLTDDNAGGRHVDTTSVSGSDNPGYPGIPLGDGLQPAFQ